MSATLTAPATTTVFESYRSDRWPYGTFRMAQVTTDTAGLIAAEPGVILRPRRGGWEVFSRGAYKPAAEGDYIVRFGSDPYFTAVVTTEYVHANYTREST